MRLGYLRLRVRLAAFALRTVLWRRPGPEFRPQFTGDPPRKQEHLEKFDRFFRTLVEEGAVAAAIKPELAHAAAAATH